MNRRRKKKILLFGKEVNNRRECRFTATDNYAGKGFRTTSLQWTIYLSNRLDVIPSQYIARRFHSLF